MTPNIATGWRMDWQKSPLAPGPSISRRCRCLSLDPQHRRALAEVTVALKNHLDAMQDSISDVRASLMALTDFLLREEGASPVS